MADPGPPPSPIPKPVGAVITMAGLTVTGPGIVTMLDREAVSQVKAFTLIAGQVYVAHSDETPELPDDPRVNRSHSKRIDVVGEGTTLTRSRHSSPTRRERPSRARIPW